MAVVRVTDFDTGSDRILNVERPMTLSFYDGEDYRSLRIGQRSGDTVDWPFRYDGFQPILVAGKRDGHQWSAADFSPPWPPNHHPLRCRSPAATAMTLIGSVDGDRPARRRGR
jgi:hypothetical protein